MEIINVILKTILFYLLIVIIIRLLGKREVGEISVFDLVVLLVIADVATIAISREWIDVLYSIGSLLTLLLLQKLFAYLTLKFPKIRNIVDYSPSILIYNGKVDLKEMKKQAYTMDDLITQARGNGVMDLNEIKLAILEPSGELSIYKNADYNNVVLPVIVSGILIDDNIDLLNLKVSDINTYLKKNNLKVESVNYLSSNGKDFFEITNLERKKNS
jgi:uncharacterized membrane protein YcaP (DUF421 family)